MLSSDWKLETARTGLSMLSSFITVAETLRFWRSFYLGNEPTHTFWRIYGTIKRISTVVSGAKKDLVFDKLSNVRNHRMSCPCTQLTWQHLRHVRARFMRLIIIILCVQPRISRTSSSTQVLKDFVVYQHIIVFLLKFSVLIVAFAQLQNGKCYSTKATILQLTPFL